ncbi:MAG: hypothetical protein HY699_13010 [Deltaproteobacteria bacterium]|nr:hypothetical protein [Deltaproteobacteria bacterium]
MGRYRRVDTRIWNDEKFSALSDRAKLAFLFVLTHPCMTSLGAMRASSAGLAAELGWDRRTFSAALGECVERGMVQYDDRAAFLWLPNFVRYNPPENGNVVRSWAKVLDLLPECPMKLDSIKRAATVGATLGQSFVEALPEPFRNHLTNPPETVRKEPAKPFRIPEPYPEPEPYRDTLPSGGFEPFWALYPRKRGKEDARKAWGVLKPDTWEAAVLMAAVTVASGTEDWQRENGRFIPYPATWLRGRRWEDQLGPPRSQSGNDPRTVTPPGPVDLAAHLREQEDAVRRASREERLNGAATGR